MALHHIQQILSNISLQHVRMQIDDDIRPVEVLLACASERRPISRSLRHLYIQTTFTELEKYEAQWMKLIRELSLRLLSVYGNAPARALEERCQKLMRAEVEFNFHM